MAKTITTTIDESLLEKLKEKGLKPSAALTYGARILVGMDYPATKVERQLSEKIERLSGRLTEITNKIYEFELKYQELRKKNKEGENNDRRNRN